MSWKRLEEIQAADPTPENIMTKANICLELQEWLKREDILRKQKSINKWLTSNELTRDSSTSPQSSKEEEIVSILFDLRSWIGTNRCHTKHLANF